MLFKEEGAALARRHDALVDNAAAVKHERRRGAAAADQSRREFRYLCHTNNLVCKISKILQTKESFRLLHAVDLANDFPLAVLFGQGEHVIE